MESVWEMFYVDLYPNLQLHYETTWTRGLKNCDFIKNHIDVVSNFWDLRRYESSSQIPNFHSSDCTPTPLATRPEILLDFGYYYPVHDFDRSNDCTSRLDVWVELHLYYLRLI